MKDNTTKNKIYSVLKEANGYISGEAISETLGITRSAVWKSINILRSEGYVIQSATNKGYRLMQSADRLNETELSYALSTKMLGKPLLFMPTVGSTNAEIKKLAFKGYPQGTTVVAETQLNGKGRLGRVWQSPPETGLWFSFLLKPELSPLHIAGITLACGMGVCMAIRNCTGLDARIKWPNDIIVNNKKVCGILTEMSAEADKINYAVVGIGINVNTEFFPEEIRHKATSLMLEKEERFERKTLFQNVLAEVEKYLKTYEDTYGMLIMEEYKQYCATLGREISVIRGNKTLCGTAIDIAKTGDLIIKTPDGEVMNINSGEVAVQGIY